MKRNALLISALMAIVSTAEPMLLTLSARENLTGFVAQADYTVPEMCENAQATSNSQPQSTSISHSEIRNLKHFKSRKILHMQDIKGNKVSATLVFSCSPGFPGTTVAQVYYIDRTYLKLQKEYPATIDGLVYHDLGADKEFCSIITTSLTKNKDGRYIVIEREIRVDDTTAQLIIDLIAGDTEWGNNTGIKFYETKSDQLAPVKVLDY